MSSEEQQPIEVDATPTQAVATVNKDQAVTKPDTKPQVTAAQAKVEAIADLTHSAYQKAGTLQLTKEEADALQADFPDEAFKTGAAGKENLIYIEHAFLRERFSKVFGMGQWAIITRRTWSESFVLPPNSQRREPTEVVKVYVEAMLVVRGCFVGEAIGDMDYFPKNLGQNYGDAVEGAKTAAFRRCAKEFGVGLQAWKKDWCQGWMDRKMAPGRRVYPPQKPSGATAPAAPPQDANRPAKAAPAAKQDVSAGMQEVKHATTKTREWFCDKVKESREQATQFCIDLTWLMPDEPLESLPLRYVPNTKPKLVEFMTKMLTWTVSGQAVAPYEADWDAEDPKNKPQNEPPPEATGDPAESEEWFNVVVPIPRKGMKRDQYMDNPDTIGSLYAARHDYEEDRKRLWGLCKQGEENGWEPKAREFNGKIYQPSQQDRQFFASLRKFKEWFDSNHDDKL